MNDEKLIELVRMYPSLYDPSNLKYMDTNFKNIIWSKIGTELKANGTLCKSRWGNMRDNFRKSLKKHKTRSGKKKVKVYKYSEQMSFIIDFFEDREQVCKSDAEVTNQYFTGDDDTTELMSHDNEENMKHFKTEVDDPLDVDLQSGTSSISIPTGSTEQPIPRKRIKQSVENTFPSNVAAATVTGYLVKRNDDTGSSPSPSQHPVDAFLSGIAPVLKKLPPQYWHYAKADIFTAVQKYELKMLMDQEQFGESYHIPT